MKVRKLVYVVCMSMLGLLGMACNGAPVKTGCLSLSDCDKDEQCVAGTCRNTTTESKEPYFVVIGEHKNKQQITVYGFQLLQAGEVKVLGLQTFLVGDVKKNGRILVTQENEFLYVVKSPNGSDKRTVERYNFAKGESKPTHTLSLPDKLQPTVIRVHKGKLYVGASDGTIEWVDFSSSQPKVQQLFKSSEKFRKEIDDFAINSNLLVAVDNVIVPKFAFVFSLDANGQPGYKFTGSLPESVNESFREATADETHLFIRSEYGHRGGSGNRLHAIKIDESKLTAEAELTEFVPRDGNPVTSPPTLLAGNGYTSWKGLEWLEGAVLVGAGSRGILQVPRPFTKSSTAKQLNVGGECRGLWKVDNDSQKKTVYVLVAKSGSTTTALFGVSWDKEQKEVVKGKLYSLPIDSSQQDVSFPW